MGRAWLTTRNTLLLSHVTIQIWSPYKSHRTDVGRGSAKKNDPSIASHLSRSLKVILTSTDLSAIYGFIFRVLVIDSTHEPISCSFLRRPKRRCRSKIANFPTAVYLKLPLNEFPLKFCNGDCAQITRSVTPLSAAGKFDDTRIRLDTIPECDGHRRTDVQRDRRSR